MNIGSVFYRLSPVQGTYRRITYEHTCTIGIRRKKEYFGQLYQHSHSLTFVVPPFPIIGSAYTSVEVTAASINAGTDLNCGSAFR
jgi:hypothetical protein